MPHIRFRPSSLSVCAIRRWTVAVLLAQTAAICWRGALAEQKTQASGDFPAELVSFAPYDKNPVFTAEGAGHWDAKIRERGWILREDDQYHMWFTGYDGTREGIRLLGYATSPDGLRWTRAADNPLVRDHWIEDMMVVKLDGTYYMFAEGLHDHAQLLTSRDRVHWERQGTLDIRMRDGTPLSPGPFGTPTAFFENQTWHLLYERADLGVWLATSRDLKTWTNVQDEPVLTPGPGEYDKQMIAVNQVINRDGIYYAYYHGSGASQAPRVWTTNVARSADLLHWQKYAANPIVPGDKSSGIIVYDGKQNRLYTMHTQVDVYFTKSVSENRLGERDSPILLPDHPTDGARPQNRDRPRRFSDKF